MADDDELVYSPTPNYDTPYYDTEEDLLADWELTENQKIGVAYKTEDNDYNFFPTIDELVKDQRENNLDAYVEEGGGIYSCFLNLRNPEEYDAQGKGWDEVPLVYQVYDEDGELIDGFATREEAEEYAKENGYPIDDIQEITEPTNSLVREVRENLKDAGVDGVIIRDVYDHGGRINTGYDTQDDYIVFSPEQIKSATDNVGTFSQSNPSILFQTETFEEGLGPEPLCETNWGYSYFSIATLILMRE